MTKYVQITYGHVVIDVPKQVIGYFDKLISRGEEIKDACKKMYFSGAKKSVDTQEFEAWRTSCLTLLRSTFGSSSPHHDSFVNLKFFDYYNCTLLYLGILQSAREDIRKGYFYHKDLMLSVNIFDALLMRARAFNENGEGLKAAGLLEAVFCEALRKLAETRGSPIDPAARGIIASAEPLLRAGVIPEDSRGMLSDLQGFVKCDNAPAAIEDDFSAWHAWVQKFLYDYLGSRIVIVN